MISSFRNFAKTKFAGLLVFIMIIPFVFWGMGSIFSGGNSNVVAKIDKINISTQDFINHINSTNIPETTIRENLDNKIIEELLSTLVSLTILNLEIEDMNIIISEKTLSNKIKSNQMFLDENNKFQRTKYEKFLLENNITASFFEMRLKNQELQKKLFDYMGAGIVVPNFLVKKLYKEENKRLELKYINLQEFYKKKEEFDNVQIEKFVKENKDQLKIEYLDFDYIIINPKILTGVDEFNQAFFDKIDQIEMDISNEINVKTIAKNFNIKPQSVTNFRLSSDANEIEKKNIRI